MTGQRGVIGFHVNFKIVGKSVMPKKPDDGLGVDVVLMVHGLHRFRLYQERTLEAD